MSTLRETVFTVGKLVQILRRLPNATPLYFDNGNNAPLIIESWNAEGECEGVDIQAGTEHGDEEAA